MKFVEVLLEKNKLTFELFEEGRLGEPSYLNKFCAGNNMMYRAMSKLHIVLTFS